MEDRASATRRGVEQLSLPGFLSTEVLNQALTPLSHLRRKFEGLLLSVPAPH